MGFADNALWQGACGSARKGKGEHHTWQSLLLPKGSEKLPSGCCSLGWGWHGRWPKSPSCSCILPFTPHGRAGEEAGWQGSFSELLRNAPGAPCATAGGGVRAAVAMEVPRPVPSGWKRWLSEGTTIRGAFSVLSLPVLLPLVEPNYWDGKPGAKKSSYGNV